MKVLPEPYGSGRWPFEITSSGPKRSVALEVAALARDGQRIGCGSGSTSFLVLKELARRCAGGSLDVAVEPTSLEMSLYCRALGVPQVAGGELDWSFDGADAVEDGTLRLVKGRGGAHEREREVALRARRVVIAVEAGKFVDSFREVRLPLSVDPGRLEEAAEALYRVFGRVLVLRTSSAKDGPVLTESGALLADLHAVRLDDRAGATLDAVPGLVGHGLFELSHAEVWWADERGAVSCVRRPA